MASRRNCTRKRMRLFDRVNSTVRFMLAKLADQNTSKIQVRIFNLIRVSSLSKISIQFVFVVLIESGKQRVFFF